MRLLEETVTGKDIMRLFLLKGLVPGHGPNRPDIGTGGGPECPMCGERLLRTLPHAAGPGIYVCGGDGGPEGGRVVGCGYLVTVRVAGGGLEVKAIAR